jgi:hypothetical protein
MGVQEGADSFGRNLFAGVQMGLNQQQYDRQESRFNRLTEIERGKNGMQPSYMDGTDHATDQATDQLNQHVMKSQDFRPTRQPLIPMSGSIGDPSQVGRLSLPGSPITQGTVTSMRGAPVMPPAPAAAPGGQPVMPQGPGSVLANPPGRSVLPRPNLSMGSRRPMGARSRFGY